MAIQITDPHEEQLPALGRMTLEDAETGEVGEVNPAQRGGNRRLLSATAPRRRMNWSSNSTGWASITFACAPMNRLCRSWDGFRTVWNGNARMNDDTNQLDLLDIKPPLD